MLVCDVLGVVCVNFGVALLCGRYVLCVVTLNVILFYCLLVIVALMRLVVVDVFGYLLIVIFLFYVLCCRCYYFG